MRKKFLRRHIGLLEDALNASNGACEALRGNIMQINAELFNVNAAKTELHKECVEYATRLTQLEKEIEALKEENTSLKFSNCALADDARTLAQRVGRVQYDLHFETPAGARQQTTAYSIPSVGVYAPILGPSAPTFANFDSLIDKLAPAFAMGTRHTKTVKVVRE